MGLPAKARAVSLPAEVTISIKTVTAAQSIRRPAPAFVQQTKEAESSRQMVLEETSFVAGSEVSGHVCSGHRMLGGYQEQGQPLAFRRLCPHSAAEGMQPMAPKAVMC
ncbi:unnamed protein product [Rangifer tarandus platyrhynchus]|uniref:Uncharacterized protein n=1 Tax=Rangifer tarandus platyrhynchus TaxID=3082113 RepID=A0AC59YJR7_RANTA